MQPDNTATKPLAWITGASSGLGRALALRLVANGWRVVVSARRAEALADLAAEAKNIVALPLDVTDQAACEAAVAWIEKNEGPLALAVLNAGTHLPVTARTLSVAPFAQLAELNLLGTIKTLVPVVAAMRARRRGQIAIVASLAGYRGLPGASAYGMSKAGLINLAEALQPELAALGIKLQLVNPGFVKTPLTDKNPFPMPFLMPLDKAAVAFEKGLQSRRFEIIFPWRLALVMKLLRLLPYGLALRLTRRLRV